MVAEVQITRLRHDFEYAWQTMRAGAATPPSDAELNAMLTRARDFVLGVDDVLAGEIGAWISEFRGTRYRCRSLTGRVVPLCGVFAW